MKNSISSIKAIPVNTRERSAHAIMVGINILNRSELESFSKEVAETFTSQMMLSRDDTTLC